MKVAFASIKEQCSKKSVSSTSSLDNPEIQLNLKKRKNLKLGKFFSSPAYETSLYKENVEVFEPAKYEGNASPLSHSSIILDSTSAFRFLNKIENLQLSPIDSIEFEKNKINCQHVLANSMGTPKIFKSLTVRLVVAIEASF